MTKTSIGKFIVIEGDDGAGKTSVINFLKERFHGGDYLSFTREPGGNVNAEEIREFFLRKKSAEYDWKTQLLLVEAARAENLSKTVTPLRKEGIHVISDRFDVSTFVYQVPTGDMAAMAYFAKINDVVTRESRPTLYIYLKLTPEEAERRTVSRGEDLSRFDETELSLRKKRYEAYNFYFNDVLSDQNVLIIDASKPLKNVSHDVWRAIAFHLSEP